MPKFMISETIHSEKVTTVRLGTDTIANAGNYSDKEVGKPVKFVGESRFALCAAGDLIEGVVSSVNLGSYDGYSIGGMVNSGYKEVTFDGLQATPGTGSVAVGDFVVAGTPAAAGTALTGPMKVCKATLQPGTTEAGAAGDVNDHINAAKFMWRVVSLGSAGTGAVGTVGVIERV
jgi:hypothetical protein